MPRWADLIIVDGRPTASGASLMDVRWPFSLTTADSLYPHIARSDPTLWEHQAQPRFRLGGQLLADNSVFQRPAPFTLVMLRRTLGSVRSPWSFTTNLSVGKTIPIREEMNFEFRVEAKNAFNHPVFGRRTPRSAMIPSER